MCRSLILSKTCNGNSKKINKCHRVSLSKRAKRKLKSLTSNLNFLSRWTSFCSRREYLCYKGWYGENKGVRQKKVLVIQKHTRICYK